MRVGHGMFDPCELPRLPPAWRGPEGQEARSGGADVWNESRSAVFRAHHSSAGATVGALQDKGMGRHSAVRSSLLDRPHFLHVAAAARGVPLPNLCEEIQPFVEGCDQVPRPPCQHSRLPASARRRQRRLFVKEAQHRRRHGKGTLEGHEERSKVYQAWPSAKATKQSSREIEAPLHRVCKESRAPPLKEGKALEDVLEIGGEAGSWNMFEHMKGVPANVSHGFLHAVPGNLIRGKAKVFLEIFAGSCRVAIAIAKLGLPAESFEINRDIVENVMSLKTRRNIIQRIRGKRVRGVWIGVSCSSWTRARRAPAHSKMPSPLRGDDACTIWGLPGLSERDQARVKGGNATALFAIDVFQACLESKTPCVIENPLTSRLWKIPQLQDLISQIEDLEVGSTVVFNHCGFGSDFCKPTKLLFCHIDLSGLEKRCHPRPLCIFNGNPLSGSSGNKWATSEASSYPVKFCNAFARIFKNKIIDKAHS